MIDLEPQKASDEQEQKKLNPIDLPDGLTVDFIRRTAEKWESSFKSFFDPEKAKILKFDEMYRTIIEGKNTESKKRIGMPVAEGIVSTVVARLQAVLFPSGKLVDAQLEDIVTEEESEAVRQEIELVENFINQKIFENNDLRREAEDFLLWCAIAGIGIAWSSWDEQVRVKYEPDPKSDSGFTKQKRKVGVWKWESVSPMDFAWDPALRNKPLNQAGWVRRKHKKTLNELKALEAKGFFDNVDVMVKEIGETAPTNDDDEQRISALGDGTTSNERLWDVFEYYGDVSYQDKKGNIQVFKAKFFIANKTWVLRAEKNPLDPQRIPAIWLRYKTRQGQGMGSSIYEAVEDLLDEITINKGKAGDITQRITNTPLLAESRTGIDPDNLWMAPNGVIAVDSVSGVMPLPVPPAALEASRVALSDDIQMVRESTPANEQIQGVSGDSGETATKTRSLIAAAGVKFQHLTQRGASEFTGPLAQECYYHYRQFGENGQMFMHQGGRDGLPLSVFREHLMRDYNFFAITAESETDKVVRIKQLKEAAADLAQLGLAEAASKLYREQILPLLGIPNAEDILPDAAPAEEGLPVGVEAPAGTPAPPETPAEAIPLPTQ